MTVVAVPPVTSPTYNKIVGLAVHALLRGEVIAVPTDTIYGFATLAQLPKSISQLYSIKKRSYNKPISICVSSISEIHQWCCVTVCDEILRDLLPGPYTLVFERSKILNPLLNPNFKLVGVRIPKCDFIVNVCHICDNPLALTSANLSEGLSPLTVEEFSDLHAEVAYVFDQGRLGTCDELRAGSTVLNLSVPGHYKVIREGVALKEALKVLHSYGLIHLTQDGCVS